MIQKHTFPSVALFLLTAINLLPGVVSQSPYIISDDRVRSLDISPVLGRGYSIMTNTFQSTCLMVDETTTPSFNYDYFYTEINSSTDTETALSGKISATLSYVVVKAEVSIEASSSTKVSTQSQMIVATMSIERYYSSVKEEVSPLAADAFTLLTEQDYVGFFKACGPNYVRSLRRAQEVSAMFKFSTTSTEIAASFAAGIKVTTPVSSYGAEASFSSKSKFNGVNSSLTIKIQGFGMGLSQGGSETLVAQSLAEYQEVMKFSFRSMTQNEDSNNIGMVYGMEVVPWVNNVAFQAAAKLGDEAIQIPLSKSLIPRAYNENDATMTFSETNREFLKCKESSFSIDKYGFCCEPTHLYDPTTETYPEPAVACVLAVCVCKPITILDVNLVKDNMVNNGEFVARLDSTMRYKLVQLGSLEKCVSSARMIPGKYLQNYLNANASVRYKRAVTPRVTVLQLKRVVDPIGDYGMVKHLGRELDEWISMYYNPCMAALYGMNIGTTPSTDVSYFMAYPWYSHPECMHLSCIAQNMRWDRDNGGCNVPSLITGFGAPGYTGDNSECALSVDSVGEKESCKFDTDELKTYHTAATVCWNNTQTVGSVDYLINTFCNPSVSYQSKQTDADFAASKTAAGTHCGGDSQKS